jgi:5-methylcytosine-specific restriction protein A
MLNAKRLAELLTERYGVAVTGEASDDADGQRARFHPAGIETTRGFTVCVLIGWRTVNAEFLPDSYAAQLLAAMGMATPEQRRAFGAFIKASHTDGATVTFRVNGQEAEPLQPDNWPVQWRSLTLSMQKGPFEINGADSVALESLALTWGGRILGCTLSLLELQRVKPVGEMEGGAYRELVTKYERSEINRAACIEIHGCQCKVCGFDFEVAYGKIGCGFIEVHHVEMVSRLEAGTVLDPEIDLVPLCSNCHSMVHRRTPPYTVRELKDILAKAAS